MALSAKYAAHRILPADPKHTVEVFLDYACPFSTKIWRTLSAEVIPYLKTQNVSFIFRHQVQPWHPNSTLLHEAALAVEKLNPAGFIPFSTLLFNNQRRFFDEATVNKTRTDIYHELTELAASINAVDDKTAMLQLLDIQSNPENPTNAGNAVTNDLKYHIKLARGQGIHVSPTVVLDGIRDESVSSSWNLDQWKSWLEPKTI